MQLTAPEVRDERVERNRGPMPDAGRPTPTPTPFRSNHRQRSRARPLHKQELVAKELFDLLHVCLRHVEVAAGVLGVVVL